jgi:hypothetical protein
MLSRISHFYKPHRDRLRREERRLPHTHPEANVLSPRGTTDALGHAADQVDPEFILNPT